MDISTFLIQLVVILLSARIFGELAAYFKVPSVMGELIAGLIIGPSLLGLIDLQPSIELLAQIGIILLLFEVGLETDLERLTSYGAQAVLVALIGVIIPFILGFGASYYLFDYSLLISLFVGCTLTTTSIGITLRVLRDLKLQNSREAQIVLGAAVLDDIIGIILLAMLYEFASGGEINLINTGKVILFIVLFFLIAPVAARGIGQVIKKWDEKCDIPGLLPTTIISLILLFAWIAHELGAPELLGGFAAGVALSKQFFKNPSFTHKVENQMAPLTHLFSPIFFVAIGLSLNLRTIQWDSSLFWILTAILVIAAIIGKLLSGFTLLQEKLKTKLLVGVSMIPRGEVGLIFANVGLTMGVFKSELYAAIILVIMLTTIGAPFCLRYLCGDE